MRFDITGRKKKILFLSCDRSLFREVSHTTRDFYDCASAVSAPSIIENEKYLEFRIFIIDVDTDPDGGFNLSSAISKCAYRDNMDIILLSSVPYGYDVSSVTSLLPEAIVLTKPISSSELSDKITELSRERNSYCLTKLKTMKKIKDVQLLKEADTNLFNKSSFIAKLNQYIEANRKSNTHLMIFGIDNLDIFNALYEDEKTTKLINHITSKLSPPLIPVSCRYGFDKIAVIVSGDAKTCQSLFNEIQIHASNFDSNRYPIIMHAGICEIFPLESDASILCSHANAAYTLAKYKESDYVISYDSKTKFQLWNGVDSVYNTRLGDMSVPSNIDSSKSSKLETPKVDNTPITVVTPIFPDATINNQNTTYQTKFNLDDDDDFYDDPILPKQEVKQIEQEQEIKFLDDDYPEDVINEPNLANQIRTSKIEETTVENYSYNPARYKHSSIDEARLAENLINKNKISEEKKTVIQTIEKPKKEQKSDEDDEDESFNTSRYDAIDLYVKNKTENEEKEKTNTSIEIVVHQNEKENKKQDDEDKAKTQKSTFNSNINYLGSDVINVLNDVEKENIENKPIPQPEKKKKKEVNFFAADSYMTEEEAKNKNISTSTNETKILSIFSKDFEKNIGKKIERKHIEIKSLSKDDFKNKCTEIIKKTNSHKAIYKIIVTSNIDDDEALNEFVYETVLDIFGKDAILSNTDNCNYLVLLSEDTDEESVVKSYAEDFIQKTQKQNFGKITCKIGIGIANPIAVSSESAIYMAQISYDRIRKLDRSAFFCPKNILKGNNDNNGTTD